MTLTFSMPVEVTHDPAMFVEHQEVRGFSRQLAHDDPGASFRRDVQGYDAIIRRLVDAVYPCSLDMSTEVPTERKRALRVPHRMEYQVQAAGFIVTGYEETVSFSRCTDLEDDCTIRWLVDFLNPATHNRAADLVEHLVYFRRSKGHQLPAFIAHRESPPASLQNRKNVTQWKQLACHFCPMDQRGQMIRRKETRFCRLLYDSPEKPARDSIWRSAVDPVILRHRMIRKVGAPDVPVPSRPSEESLSQPLERLHLVAKYR